MTEARRRPAPALLPVVVFLAVFALIVIDASGLVLRDGDTYWHLVVGRWILDHGTLPHRDFLSFTAADRPWIPHEWLAEVLLAASDRLAGWSGVVALTAFAAAATLGLLAHHLGRFLATLPATLVVLLAGLSVILVLLARPHMLALPLLEFWTAGLVVARAAGRTPGFALLPVMVLWANLHGGFMVGVALAWLLGIEAVLAAQADRLATARRWGGFALAATLAAMVTPNFPDGFLLPFRFLGMNQMFAIVVEWRSPDFQNVDPLEVMLLSALLFGFGRGFSMSWFRLVLLLGLVWSAFQHVRNEVLVGIAGSLLIAEALGRHLGSRPFRPAVPGLRPLLIETAIGAPTLLAILGVLAFHPVVRQADSVTPSAALARLPAALRDRPVFNDYNFGGYLIFSGIRPFIDGRTDMYPPELLGRYAEAAAGNSAALQAVLADYRIDWTLLAPGSPVVAVLDASPGWSRLYADDVAVLQVRREALPAP